MTLSVERLEHAPLAAADATTASRRRRPVPDLLRFSVVIVGDLLGAVVLVLCLPFVILALGIPIALCVQALLWLGRLL